MCDEVTFVVLKFFNEGCFDNAINFTYIVLILKKKNFMYATNFWPISLYNVNYKLVSKVLANRLKHILLAIISKNQSAFMPRRLIIDNIIVAYEALNSIKIRKKERKGNMEIKLDISKVYDKVEWSFLETAMRKFGFNEAWILKIMTCVTMVSYAMLINSQLYQWIIPSRGLCQGNRISPYMYLICA